MPSAAAHGQDGKVERTGKEGGHPVTPPSHAVVFTNFVSDTPLWGIDPYVLRTGGTSVGVGRPNPGVFSAWSESAPPTVFVHPAPAEEVRTDECHHQNKALPRRRP